MRLAFPVVGLLEQRQGLVLLEERTFPHARRPNFNRICTASEPKADAVIGPLKGARLRRRLSASNGVQVFSNRFQVVSVAMVWLVLRLPVISPVIKSAS